MDTKKKALDKFVQKKWRPQDYFGSFETNESIPQAKGLLQTQGTTPQAEEYSAPETVSSQYDPELIGQLGLSLSPMGEPILDDDDENLLNESIDNPENMTTRGKYLYDLMVDEEDDGIRDPRIARNWQARHAR